MVREDCINYYPPGREDEYCMVKNDVFLHCEECKKYKSKYTKTNADRIRAMTDEELAEFLWKYAGIGVCPPITCTATEKCGAEKCWLDWLREEAGKEANDG